MLFSDPGSKPEQIGSCPLQPCPEPISLTRTCHSPANSSMHTLASLSRCSNEHPRCHMVKGEVRSCVLIAPRPDKLFPGNTSSVSASPRSLSGAVVRNVHRSGTRTSNPVPGCSTIEYGTQRHNQRLNSPLVSCWHR